MEKAYICCNVFGCAAAATDLLLCDGCLRVHYCSRRCQRNDWTTHRIGCSRDPRQRMRGILSYAVADIDRCCTKPLSLSGANTLDHNHSVQVRLNPHGDWHTKTCVVCLCSVGANFYSTYLDDQIFLQPDWCGRKSWVNYWRCAQCYTAERHLCLQSMLPIDQCCADRWVASAEKVALLPFVDCADVLGVILMWLRALDEAGFNCCGVAPDGEQIALAVEVEDAFDIDDHLADLLLIQEEMSAKLLGHCAQECDHDHL